MRAKSISIFILTLTLATLSCGLNPASSSTEPAPTQATESAPTISPLSIVQLKSAQYQLGARDDHAVIQFTDGVYKQGTDATTMDFAYVAVTQFVAFGDLTGDGVDEAAVMVLENYGGTGNFGFLTIYTNVNGLPVFLYSVLIDDRPMINSLAVENGEVFLDAIVHGFDDGGCCPKLPTTRRYALVNNQLKLVNYTTATPAGAQRVIDITSPINETEASSSIQLSGSISVAPFENNLTYFIYDAVGNQLAVGPVQVAAPDFGAPGTFNETISLQGIPAGTTVYIEVQDQSAADGTILALDAVKLIIK